MSTKTVTKWTAKVVTGIAYDDIKDEYLAGKITASRAAEMYVKYGGMSQEEAQEKVMVYDWEADGYEHVTVDRINDYEKHCEALNIPKDVYLEIRYIAANTENDKDENGKSINYSAMQKVMSVINSYPLTSGQKDAVAKSIGWSDKNIRKYKLW